MKRFAALALISAHALPVAVAALSPERQREILRDALRAFDRAVAVTRSDPGRAENLYRDAAAGFQALLESGVRNAALEYNLGNAYYRLGQVGHAVLHYRRAQRIDPGDAEVRANLDYAREHVEPHIAAGGQRELLRRLLFWHYRMPIRARFWVAVVGSVAGWLGLLIWLRLRRRPLASASLIVVGLSLLFTGSVAWQLREQTREPPAVVLETATLRLGRGQAYDPALAEPLGPGVELVILEERGDWVKVRLPNGQDGWLPLSAVERV